MSSPTKKRKQKKNKKKNPKNNMQQRKGKNQQNSQSSKNKSHKKHKQPGQFETNLSWIVALLLLSLIAFVLIYAQMNNDKQSIVSIEADSHSDTHKSKKEWKYDHSLCAHNKYLQLSKAHTTAPVPLLFKAKVSQMWSHDKDDFTQGLEVIDVTENGKIVLLESTGLYKQSKLKYIELDLSDSTNKAAIVQRSHSLGNDYFGEGCTVYFDGATEESHIYQLTWKRRKAIVYDLELRVLKELDLPSEMSEGWGIYYDLNDGQFIATDGSAQLFFIDADTFTVRRTVTVKYHNNDRKVLTLRNLNEIEMVNGWILANVWYNSNIYVISPHNGFVYGIIECWHIFPREIRRKNHAVLNGIGFDSVNDRLIITGKNWPNVFAIELPQFMSEQTQD